MPMLILFVVAFVATLIARATGIAAAGDALATAELLKTITIALMLATVLNGLYGLYRLIFWRQLSYFNQPLVNVACLLLAVLLIALQHAAFIGNLRPLHGYMAPPTGAALWQLLPWLCAAALYTGLHRRNA